MSTLPCLPKSKLKKFLCVLLSEFCTLYVCACVRVLVCNHISRVAFSADAWLWYHFYTACVHVFEMCLHNTDRIWQNRLKYTNKQINFFGHRINFITVRQKLLFWVNRFRHLCVQHLCGCDTIRCVTSCPYHYYFRYSDNCFCCCGWYAHLVRDVHEIRTYTHIHTKCVNVTMNNGHRVIYSNKTESYFPRR